MEVAAASGEPVCITPTPKPERTLQCYGATDGATTSRIHGERNCTVTLVQGAALYPLRRSPRPSRAVADVTPGPSDRRALPPPAAGRAAIHLHDLPVRRAPWPCCGFGLVVALALLWRWPCCGVLQRRGRAVERGAQRRGKRAAAFNNWATVVTTAALGLIGLCTIAAAERATPRWQVSQRSVVRRCTGMQMCRWGNNSVKIDPMQFCYLHDR